MPSKGPRQRSAREAGLAIRSVTDTGSTSRVGGGELVDDGTSPTAASERFAGTIRPLPPQELTPHAAQSDTLVTWTHVRLVSTISGIIVCGLVIMLGAAYPLYKSVSQLETRVELMLDREKSLQQKVDALQTDNATMKANVTSLEKQVQRLESREDARSSVPPPAPAPTKKR